MMPYGPQTTSERSSMHSRLGEKPTQVDQADRGDSRIRHPRHQRAGLCRRLRILGCIRMYNQDVAELYRRVGVGTPVMVVR